MTQSRRRASWLAAASVALAVFAAAAPARAQGFDLEGFFIEIPVGVGVPVAEDSYETLNDAGFWTGVNMGYLFAVGGGSVAIGPAADMQYAFGNIDNDFDRDGALEDDIYVGRFRAIGGARFVVAVEDAYILMRLGVGLDIAHASWDYYEGGAGRHIEGDHEDVSFGLISGLGMGYRIIDLIGVTFLLDLPIGFHDESSDRSFVHWDGELIDIVLSGAVNVGHPTRIRVRGKRRLCDRPQVER